MNPKIGLNWLGVAPFFSASIGKKGACMLPTNPQHIFRRPKLITANTFLIMS